MLQEKRLKNKVDTPALCRGVIITACMGTTLVVMATPMDTRCLLLYSLFLGGEIDEVSLDHFLWVKSRRDFSPLCHRVERVSE